MFAPLTTPLGNVIRGMIRDQQEVTVLGYVFPSWWALSSKAEAKFGRYLAIVDTKSLILAHPYSAGRPRKVSINGVYSIGERLLCGQVRDSGWMKPVFIFLPGISAQGSVSNREVAEFRLGQMKRALLLRKGKPPLIASLPYLFGSDDSADWIVTRDSPLSRRGFAEFNASERVEYARPFFEGDPTDKLVRAVVVKLRDDVRLIFTS